jgi:hypothetical protein
MATASTAFASSAGKRVATAEALSVPDSATTRLEVVRTQPSSRSESEAKPVRVQPQVLSKNFANPKPVQIYWFFGGR